MTSSWTEKPLGEIMTLQRGFDLPKKDRREGQIPIISSSGAEDFHAAPAKLGPGVVTGRYGTIGKVFYTEDPYWPLNTTLFVSNFQGNHPKYCYYLLSRFDFQEHSGKTGVPGVNRNDLHSVSVTTTTDLREQEAIAAALSDADALIEGLERLIAKKRLIKQGAMQDLLTAERRLPGFSGDWVEHNIQDIAYVDPEALGAGTSRDRVVRYISLEDVNRGVLSGWTETTFGQAPSRARRILRQQDILLGTVRPNLQSHYLFEQEGENWIGSTGFAVLRARRELCSARYLFEVIMSDIISRQVDELIAGSNYPAISNRDVRKLRISLPHLEEQQEISEILSDMDAEIQALETRLGKARQMKEGMMQNLLTGRVRLV